MYDVLHFDMTATKQKNVVMRIEQSWMWSDLSAFSLDQFNYNQTNSILNFNAFLITVYFGLDPTSAMKPASKYTVKNKVAKFQLPYFNKYSTVNDYSAKKLVYNEYQLDFLRKLS